MRIVLLRKKHIWTKLHVQHELLYFYLHFALNIVLGDRCDRKHQNNYFIQVKPHLFVVEFSKHVSF